MSVPAQKYITKGGAVHIGGQIEAAIRDGRLAPGDKLPPVRGLATQLGVSPATVAAAYKALRERGLLVGQGRNGTAVSRAPSVLGRRPVLVPQGVRNLSFGNPDRELLPSLDALIDKLSFGKRLYDDNVVCTALEALAKRSLEADGIPAHSIAVTSGALDGVERVLAAHLRPGDRVLVEDPGFTGVLDLLAALGLEAEPVEVDDEGPIPDALRRALERSQKGNGRAFVVTPRAQNPTGAALSAQRARDLRRILAKAPDLVLIEDDHAAGVAGSEPVTLVDAHRRHWAVIRSVAKSLGPDLRVAVASGDEATIARLEGRQLMGMRWVSHILQHIVAKCWSDAATRRALLRAEKTYAKRRTALLDALARFGIRAHGRSGMNVWIPVVEEAATSAGLLALGWAVAPGERFRLKTGPGIRVTVAALDPQDAERFAADLASLLVDAAPGSTG